MFPILGDKDELVKRALTEHSRLIRLFTDTNSISKSLSLIEEELEQHIRFEERILFNKIQKATTEKQLKTISELHIDPKLKDNTADEFWK